MFGRTYAIGYEQDLESTLITRPVERVTDPATPWAIWYPLRRKGEFVNLPPGEQRTILMEHGGIGRAFGRAGYGGDIRLACYGLDKNDNDFVVALIGPELYPLSAIVERMRKTKQTSQAISTFKEILDLDKKDMRAILELERLFEYEERWLELIELLRLRSSIETSSKARREISLRVSQLATRLGK